MERGREGEGKEREREEERGSGMESERERERERSLEGCGLISLAGNGAVAPKRIQYEDCCTSTSSGETAWLCFCRGGALVTRSCILNTIALLRYLTP